ncbi:hypothetical protein AB6813_00960 [bacterium RCC_150]
MTITPDTDLVGAFREVTGEHGFDVIIDPVWGDPPWPPCTPRPGEPVISRSASPPRQPSSCPPHSRSGLELLGFAHVDPPLRVRRNAYLKLTELAATGALAVDTMTIPLADCQRAWELQQQGAPRKLVLTP